jgi:predicted GNAT superfamily acetyltransferase
VREDARDRGVGKRLKEHQRAAAKASGATTMYWTYDPLVARNAHLNFNRLGVTVDEYVEDMYGASESDLHRGLGTDRFVVAWPLDEESRADPRRSPASAGEAAEAAVLNPDARSMTPSRLAALDAAPPAALRVEIPLDIVRVRDTVPEEAARWRGSTRQAFEWALGRGYNVDRFIADQSRGRGHYHMTRMSAGAGQ